MAKGKRKDRKLAWDIRQIEAVRLRLEGRTFEEIAKQLGYRQKSGAFNAIRRAIKKSMTEGVEELVAQQRLRLNALRLRLNESLHLVAQQLVTHQGKRKRMDQEKLVSLVDAQRRVIMSLVKIDEREAALMGLDMQPRMSPGGNQQVSIEFVTFQGPNPHEKYLEADYQANADGGANMNESNHE